MREIYRPSRAAINAAMLLQSPFIQKENVSMSTTASEAGIGKNASSTGNKSGVRFGTVAPKQGDMPEYIKADELTQFPKFTIYNARLRASNLNPGAQEVAFDVAVRVDVSEEHPNGVMRRTITLAANEDRQAVMRLVKQHGALTNVRLDHIKTRNPNGYWKFRDAEEPREDLVEAGAGGTVEKPALKDDDIPF